jgi:O-antigen ligase
MPRSAKALALAAGGLLLAFGAPAHRVDLLAIGVIVSAVAVVWQPLVGPVVVGAALPFFFFARPLIGPLGVTPPGLALVLSWLAIAVRHRALTLRWPSSPYDRPLALFLVASLASLLVTEYPLLSARELRALIFEPIAFFILLQTLRGSPRLALTGFIVGATVTAIAAIAQIALGLGGTEAEGVRRAQAWYPSANHLALMLGRAWPFLLAGGLVYARWLWLPALSVGLGLLLTFSTGGWLGSVAATIAVVWLLRGRAAALRLATSALMVGALVSGAAVAGALPERLNPLRQTGGFRVDLWVSSLQMIRDHPLLGVGLDNFVYLYQQVYLREGAAAEPNLSHPHNWVLHMWLELGLLGLIAFVWLLERFVRQVLKSRTWIVAGAAGAIVDMLVHGAIDNSYFLVDLAFVFWLCLVLVDVRSQMSDDRLFDPGVAGNGRADRRPGTKDRLTSDI